MDSGALIRSWIKLVTGSKRATSPLCCEPGFDRACRSGSGLFDGSLGTFSFWGSRFKSLTLLLHQRRIALHVGGSVPLKCPRQPVRDIPATPHFQPLNLRNRQKVASGGGDEHV